MSKTICLNMIVKNESKIITRLFDSVLSIIDCYCICDTGSTDNTIEIIKQYFLDKNIPGKIVIKPFINFAYNRSFSLTEANGMSDYVLLLDADMILQVNNFKKDMLGSFDSYSILQGNNYLKYPNKRIVRNNGLFKYVGVTHEYIECIINHTTSTIDEQNLFIYDIGDGGAKSDKFERDIRLLTKGIEDEPENMARYTFYLANSYRDYNNPEKAIEYYKRVLTLNNWEQEKYMSCLSIYRQYEKLNKKQEGIYYLIESYKYDKQRVECIYNLIVHYCINGLNEIAMSFYKLIQESFENNSINFNSKLFNEPMIYDFYLPYYMIIIADRLGDRKTGIKMYEILFKTKPLFFDLWWIKNLFFNYKFFVNHIPQDLKKQMNILSKDYVKFLLDNNVDLTNVELN
jgi:tetratricopeptide (TPR) repeat protein